jgi:hypothetical protein
MKNIMREELLSGEWAIVNGECRVIGKAFLFGDD